MNKPNFSAMADAARRANEEQEQKRLEALQQELDQATGEAYVAFEDVYESDTLDHNAKVGLFRAAVQALSGQTVSSAVPVAPVAASAASFDYASLPEETRRIIDMVVAEPGRFKIEAWGAVKDKSYTRLRRDYDAAQAPAADQGGSSSDKADVPAPVKKSDSPKKAAEKSPEAEKKPGLRERAVAAAKAARENAKQ